MRHLAYLTKLPSFAIERRFTQSVTEFPYSHYLTSHVGCHVTGFALAKDRFQYDKEEA